MDEDLASRINPRISMARPESLDVRKLTQPRYSDPEGCGPEFLRRVGARVPLLLMQMELCNKREMTDPF